MSGRKASARVDLADLLGQVAKGDRAALRSIYVRQANRLFGLAVAILRDRVIAADVLQQGFVLIWQQAARFDPARETAEAWMAAILRHAALDAARAHGRERPLDAGALVAFGVDPEAFEALQAAPDLAAALEGLGPEQRRAVVLAYVHGLSLSELAAHLGQPLEAVTQSVRQGLAGLGAGLA
jgi:RNA polymerase sigma-70 factor (ECF subfamily)